MYGDTDLDGLGEINGLGERTGLGDGLIERLGDLIGLMLGE